MNRGREGSRDRGIQKDRGTKKLSALVVGFHRCCVSIPSLSRRTREDRETVVVEDRWWVRTFPPNGGGFDRWRISGRLEDRWWFRSVVVSIGGGSVTTSTLFVSSRKA
ncbi:hypothetical protein YC2023_018824 [Brassica napus]